MGFMGAGSGERPDGAGCPARYLPTTSAYTCCRPPPDIILCVYSCTAWYVGTPWRMPAKLGTTRAHSTHKTVRYGTIISGANRAYGATMCGTGYGTIISGANRAYGATMCGTDSVRMMIPGEVPDEFLDP
eukprot:3801517-Rhodomonas_salina.3